MIQDLLEILASLENQRVEVLSKIAPLEKTLCCIDDQLHFLRDVFAKELADRSRMNERSRLTTTIEGDKCTRAVRQ